MTLPALAVSAALLVSAAITATPTALGATPDPPASEASTSIPTNITPIDQIPAHEAGAQIARAATGYPEVFGGTEWDSKSKTLYVNVAAPHSKQADRRAAFQQGVSARLRATKSQVRTVFRSVPLSLAGQEALLDSFMDDRASWGGQSAVRNVVSAVVNEKTGRISAQVVGDLTSLREAARRRFGDTVSLRLGKGFTPYDRYYDTAPWTAGNALWNDQYWPRGQALCTQGFNWRRWSDNLGYASTAGHCFEPGQSVFNGSTTQRIGYVGTKYLNNGEYVDFEYIRITFGSVDNSVWVGGLDGELRRVVAADNDGTQLDDIVCSSSANGGLDCGRIIRRNARATYHTKPGMPTIYNLTCVEPTSGGMPVPGDSGGPVLSTFSNGTVMAWGQVTGGLDCDGDGDEEWLFATVKNISARVGASVITS